MKTKKRKYLIILCVLALAALLLSGCTQETASLDYIGAENASSLALESVGLTEGQVERISASLSTKNGVDYYEVELTVDGVQYEIDVDALTGVIIDGEAPASAAEQAAQVAAQVAATLETAETETAAVTEETAASAAESTANTAGADTAVNSTNTAANTSSASTAATSSASSTSTAANAAAVTEDEAKAIALADAGLTEAEVTITKLKLDYDNGQQVYDIEFYTANYDEYDYEISVSTGAIVERDYDPAKTTSTASTSTGTTSTSGTGSTSGSTSSTGSSSTTSTLITESEARSIALASAGLSESGVTFTKTKLDTDDGQKVYDVEFYTTDAEYEYEINASTGAILDSSYEVRSTASTSTSTSTTITADEAKAIALAQVPGASASNIREFETDYDDGRLQYEGKIIYDGMEYEFEIDGYSGAIRSWEAERAD
ncbi:MAG: PepSY domain-containing protein [Oscillospiraceae bacterium]|nr:PepSY domain-containing protein [Oscillospiraceae bacterium]